MPGSVPGSVLGLGTLVLESRVRLRCLDDGLVPEDLQVGIRDEHAQLLARADTTFRRTAPGALPLLLEADGRGPHDGPEALCTRSRLAVPTMVLRAL